ncbi:MAG: undecaprenyl-diphosphate phosphatase [Bdellovibrionales bacterium]|nr:undecaprenyl-diphosphate phosphatase [Oligoflexia bacterium]
MNIFQILLLAFVQGMAELLPISSSAHVIVAEKLMGLDPASPEMTFLLVMLHTGTMFAVLFYFWRRWLKIWKAHSHQSLIQALVVATLVTGAVGLTLKKLIEKVFIGGESAEIEQIFGNLKLVAAALFSAGVLILIAGLSRKKSGGELSLKNSAVIGMVQGLCLPFRGFSRSGATISTAMLLGVSRELAEDFSFALAVILTPPVILRELMRLVKSGELSHELTPQLFFPGLAGMVFSFFAGLLALRWLASWMEKGRWHWFGYYCVTASLFVFFLSSQGY